MRHPPSRAGKTDSEDVLSIARSGFAQYEFYIPYMCPDYEPMSDETPDAELPAQSYHILLINRDNGIKSAALFTDAENSFAFAREHDCRVAKMTYADYKAAIAEGVMAQPAAEGIIINPDGEQILLPPDYPLL